jgi:hypothetical protein
MVHVPVHHATMMLMRRITGVLLLGLTATVSDFAQATGAAAKEEGPATSVPFVGCASSGQSERLEAPSGTNKRAPMSSEDAQALAFYESANGIGILAPRGWYCAGVWGSAGSALFVSPSPIHQGASGGHGLDGPAIEVNHLTSENSGRYEIAELMGRVFPAYRTLATEIMSGIDLPLPAGPYPKDTLKYRGKTTVEYETPAHTEGLGNFHSWLGKSGLPIKGAAILSDDGPAAGVRFDLVLLSVRVPPSLTGLVPAIVGQFERDTIGSRWR